MLARRQGNILSELTALGKMRAKTLAETRSILIDMENRMNLARAATQHAIHDTHAKCILSDFMDATTR